jgi:hypothetical protein
MPRRRKSPAPLRQYSVVEIEALLERALTALTGQPLTVRIEGLEFSGKDAELRVKVAS